MMKIYWSNDSYPELLPVESRWRRHVIWWKAFWSARRDCRFWLVLASMLAAATLPSFLGFALLPDPYFSSGAMNLEWVFYARLGLVIISGILWMVIALTFGAETLRPHLRHASPLCRQACPECGQLLTSQIEGISEGEPVFQCPECGSWFDRRPFFEPFDIHARAHVPHHAGSVSSKPDGSTQRMDLCRNAVVHSGRHFIAPDVQDNHGNGQCKRSRLEDQVGP